MNPDDNPSSPPDADGPTRTVRLRAGESTAMAVVVAVADTLNREPLELEPLSTLIDTDALDRLVTEATEEGVTLYVAFQYADCEVVVTPNEVRVRGSFDEAGGS